MYIWKDYVNNCIFTIQERGLFPPLSDSPDIWPLLLGPIFTAQQAPSTCALSGLTPAGAVHTAALPYTCPSQIHQWLRQME